MCLCLSRPGVGGFEQLRVDGEQSVGRWVGHDRRNHKRQRHSRSSSGHADCGGRAVRPHGGGLEGRWGEWSNGVVLGDQSGSSVRTDMHSCAHRHGVIHTVTVVLVL